MVSRARWASGHWTAIAVLAVAAVTAVLVVALVVPAGGSRSASGHRRSADGASAQVYPRLVRVADVPDANLRETASQADPPVTVLVELAPGVYANRRPGPIGNLDDYPAVFGRCADVNRYPQSHRVARTCW